MAMRGEKIIVYTLSEGTSWMDWPMGAMSDYVPTDDFLTACKHARRRVKYILRGNTRFCFVTYIHGISVHSFKTSAERCWDCLNGWTK